MTMTNAWSHSCAYCRVVMKVHSSAAGLKQNEIFSWQNKSAALVEGLTSAVRCEFSEQLPYPQTVKIVNTSGCGKVTFELLKEEP